MSKKLFEVTKIRENVLQVEDAAGVYFTIIKGEKEAIIWDTGYGFKDIKAFVETQVTTPYKVLLSHGHPDHIGGSVYFEEVYITKEDQPVFKEYIKVQHSQEALKQAIAEKQILEEDVAWLNNRKCPMLKNLEIGRIFDLGGLHAEVIAMPGHTHGSAGLLLKEERLLLSGDAVNNGLWLFLPESMNTKVCEKMIEEVLKLPFETYLGEHTTKEYSKAQLRGILENLRHLKVDEKTKCSFLGLSGIYESKRICAEDISSIFFYKNKTEQV